MSKTNKFSPEVRDRRALNNGRYSGQAVDDLEAPGASYQVRLEAGPGQVAAVEAGLAALSHMPVTERLFVWTRHFFGTPFAFESQLPALGRNELRVRFSSFDCITFIYTLIALARSRSLAEFAADLATLRYDVDCPRDIDNDPVSGNFLDFSSESLLVRALERGVLTDVTLEAGAMTFPLSARLEAHRRWSLGPREQEMIAPRYGERDFTYRFMAPLDLRNVPSDRLQDGDILIFSHTRARAPRCLVSHAAVLRRSEGELYFVHCTRGVIAPSSRDGSTAFTGAFMDDEKTFEQIGVSYGLEYAGDDQIFVKDGLNHYPYVATRRRKLFEYAEENFQGVCIMRVLPK